MDRDDDFQVILDDDNISGNQPVEPSPPLCCDIPIERLLKKINTSPDPHNIVFKIGRQTFGWNDFMIGEDQNKIKALCDDLDEKIDNFARKLVSDFDRTNLCDCQKSGLHHLFIFDPDPKTIIHKSENIVSVENKDRTQRLKFSVNEGGISIAADKLPKQPFAVIAQPSLRIHEGKRGKLNLHVTSTNHIDISGTDLSGLLQKLHRYLSSSPSPTLLREY